MSYADDELDRLEAALGEAPASEHPGAIGRYRILECIGEGGMALSAGQRERVAIARALITHPAIVLADEPTGNLDTKNSDAVLRMLVRSNQELGQTTLMITHNPEAAAIAGRILHMRDGEIIKVENGLGYAAVAEGRARPTGCGGIAAV